MFLRTARTMAEGSTAVRAQPTLASSMDVPMEAMRGCGGAGAGGGAHIERRWGRHDRR